MLRGLTPSTTRPSRGSAPRNRLTEQQGLTNGRERASGGPATGNPATGDSATGDLASDAPASDSGRASVSKGTLPADGDWSEEMRIKDELISTLKRQLTALGEQPIEEVVTLEVRKCLKSGAT